MKWSKKDEEFLKENYHKRIPLKDLGKEINKSPKAISHKAQRLNLSRPWVRFNKPKKRFSRKEIEKRYYNKNKKLIYKKKVDRRRRIKEEAIKMLGGKCSECGYKKCSFALDFHHEKGNKEGNVSSLLKNESRQKLLKEAKKCILLCANCHRELHNEGQ